MKLTFDRKTFVDALKNLSMVVANDPSFTNTMSFVRVSHKGDGLMNIAGTDMACAMSIDVQSKSKDGFDNPFLLPLGTMSKVLTRCESDEVEFKDSNEGREITMKAGNCRTKLRTLASDGLPEMSFDVDGGLVLTVSARDAFLAFDKTSVSMCIDRIDHENMRGLLIERVEGSHDVSVVGANGYQLSAYRISSTDIDPGPFRVTFPAKYVPVAVKMLKDATDQEAKIAFVLKDTKIIVATPSWTMSSTMSAREFPAWSHLILPDDEYQPPVEIDPKAWLDMIERVDSVCDGMCGSFAMGFIESQLKVTAINGGTMVHATDSTPVGYTGKDIFFGCNPRYFASVLKKASGEADVVVRVGWRPNGEGNGEFLPIRIDDGDFRNIVLPLRGIPSFS